MAVATCVCTNDLDLALGEGDYVAKDGTLTRGHLCPSRMNAVAGSVWPHEVDRLPVRRVYDMGVGAVEFGDG